MKKLITLFSIAVAFSFATQAQDAFVIPGMTAPAIDADASDWSETWIDQAAGKEGNATDAMTSKFQIGHDADNIYLIFEVSDATPGNDATAIPNTYERDCIEAFFSMHSVTEDAALVSGDWQLRVQRATELETMFEGKTEVAAAEEAGDFVASVDDDGASMYTIELSLSIAALAQDSDFDGENLRMEFQTADNTTGAASGRTQQQFWMDNSDSGWNNVNVYSPAVLGPMTSNKENANVKATAFVSKNNIIVKNATGMVSIYDVAGKLVRTSAQHTINVSDLRSGLYIVKGKDFSVKVIK